MLLSKRCCSGRCIVPPALKDDKLTIGYSSDTWSDRKARLGRKTFFQPVVWFREGVTIKDERLDGSPSSPRLSPPLTYVVSPTVVLITDECESFSRFHPLLHPDISTVSKSAPGLWRDPIALLRVPAKKRNRRRNEGGKRRIPCVFTCVLNGRVGMLLYRCVSNKCDSSKLCAGVWE